MMHLGKIMQSDNDEIGHYGLAMMQMGNTVGQNDAVRKNG